MQYRSVESTYIYSYFIVYIIVGDFIHAPLAHRIQRLEEDNSHEDGDDARAGLPVSERYTKDEEDEFVRELVSSGLTQRLMRIVPDISLHLDQEDAQFPVR